MRASAGTLIFLCCLLHGTSSEDDVVVDEQPRKFVSPFTLEEREKFLEREKNMSIGSSIKLSYNERLVNDVLMHYKMLEYDAGLKDPEKFPPSRHFFHSKEDIDASKVFAFIKQIPKGANLRTYLPVSTSGDFLYQMSLEEHLYICRKDDTHWYLRFFGENVDEGHPQWTKRCNWQLVSELRGREPDFDRWLRKKLTMVVDEPYEVYSSSSKVHRAFDERLNGIKEMLNYWPVFAEHFYQLLEEMHEDNVMYVEFHSAISGAYELNQTSFELDNVAHWKEILRLFFADNRSFFGAKVVYDNRREVVREDILKVLLNIFHGYRTKYESFVAGFDISGEEDNTRNLTELSSTLKLVPGVGPLLLQAGATNWYGSSDENLVDAVMMGAQRIGHALALVKHPEVMRVVKEKGIAVEICPVSDQVFRYVDDLRNHPAAVLFANDYPVVVCNCHPGFFGYKGLSYDWYMAFMGIARRDADLRTLKQLGLNSILYSAMGKEKEEALRYWNLKWNVFVTNVLDQLKDSDILKTVKAKRDAEEGIRDEL